MSNHSSIVRVTSKDEEERWAGAGGVCSEGQAIINGASTEASASSFTSLLRHDYRDAKGEWDEVSVASLSPSSSPISAADTLVRNSNNNSSTMMMPTTTTTTTTTTTSSSSSATASTTSSRFGKFPPCITAAESVRRLCGRQPRQGGAGGGGGWRKFPDFNSAASLLMRPTTAATTTTSSSSHTTTTSSSSSGARGGAGASGGGGMGPRASSTSGMTDEQMARHLQDKLDAELAQNLYRRELEEQQEERRRTLALQHQQLQRAAPSYRVDPPYIPEWDMMMSALVPTATRSGQIYTNGYVHRRGGGGGRGAGAGAGAARMPHQFAHLSGRELTENDYDLLLQLDEGVKKKKGLTRPQISQFATRKLKNKIDPKEVDDTVTISCAICMSEYEAGDKLRHLGCHEFHADCIDTWIKANPTCPVCKRSLVD